MRLRLLVVVLCAVLAGCGSDVDARNAYVDEVNRARTAFDRDVAQITGRLRETSTSRRTRRTLRALERAARAFEQRLAGVRPPEAVAAEHRRLIAQVQGYGVEFRRAQAAFRTDDPNAYLEARTELQRDVASAGTRLNAVIDAVNTALRR